jgi:hypothetical protein
MGVYRYKQKQVDARSFAQWRRAADKRESASGLRNRSFFLAHFSLLDFHSPVKEGILRL